MSDTSEMSDTSTEYAPSIASSVTQDVAEALFKCFSESTYACGGTVKIAHSAPSTSKTPGTTGGTSRSTTIETSSVGPVTIRWDSATSIEKIILPLSSPDGSNEHSPIAKLVAETQPASFGFKGEDIVDESYRKASKLDESAFSTNFCPYESGIIDVIDQALLPKISSSSPGIRVELYKLNVYQAPSGFFKPHVDTPRSELQFGSLVVCLPCEHEGGQLVVRHRGQSTTFDWSGPSKSIKWAAFYSDCEHEVLEVTSGHRVTLTYNLYMRRKMSKFSELSQRLDVQDLPVYQEVLNALARPDFMANGGLLGKYCCHAYAHATDNAASTFPAILKGSDMVAFEVFRSLGLKYHIRPVIEHIRNHEDDDEYYDENPELLTHNHIIHDFAAPIITGCQWGYGGSIADVYDEVPNELAKVAWMNDPTNGTENMQFAFTVYGNEAGTAFGYSYCALLFEIPSYSERTKLANIHGRTRQMLQKGQKRSNGSF